MRHDHPLLLDDFVFPTADPATARRGTKATLIDDANQIYRVSDEPVPVGDIIEVRVGGIPWRKVVRTPSQGEWAIIDLADGGTFQLGAVTVGAPVRCDIEGDISHEEWRTLNECDRARRP